MRKHLNIKSIILENGIEINVEQIIDKEDGIKFKELLDNDIECEFLIK